MNIIRQIGLLLALCFAAQGVELLLPFAFPASVIAMLMLLLCLLCGLLRHGQVREMSDFLLNNMAFFFVPSGVSVINHLDLLAHNALALIAVCAVSTVATFAATAYSVRLVCRLQARAAARRAAAR